MSANRILSLTGRGELRIYDSGATNYTSIKSAASLASPVSFILPSDNGTAGYQLATDGAGNLTWVPPGGSEEFAQVIILGQGPLELQDAAGGEFVRIRAPAVVANSYTLTLPDDLPPSTKFLAVSDAGVVSYTDGASTLQTAYDAGATITLDATGPVTLTQPEENYALIIDGTDTGAGGVVSITNASSGAGIDIVQDGNGFALYALKTDGGKSIVKLEGSGTLSGSGLEVVMPSTGSGVGVSVANDGSGIGARVTQATAAATAAQVNQGTNAICLDLNKTGAGAGNCLDIDNDGTGEGIHIEQDGDGMGLVLDQDGNAVGAQINQAANQIGLDINKTGAGAGAALDIDNDGTGVGLNLRQDGAAIAALITQNGAGTALSVAQTQNQIGLSVIKTGSGANQAVYIENDGTGIGLQVAQDGDAVACQIAAASASSEAVLQLTHGSSDPFPDVRGTSGLWEINNRGTPVLTRAVQKTATHTISGGAVTITSSLPGGFLVIDTEAAAASDNLDNILSDSSDPVTAGTVIYLRAANSARTVVARSLGGGTGNLRLTAGGDFSLDNADDIIALIYNGTNWLEIGQSSNGG